MSIQIQPAAASLWRKLEWAGILPDGVTLVSVAHSVPTGLVLEDESTDVANSYSYVKVSGGYHAGKYLVRGVAALSNGDSLPYDFDLRVFG